MNRNNLALFLLISFISILVSGCVSIPTRVPPNYKFSSSEPNKGLLAANISCGNSGEDGIVDLVYRKLYSSDRVEGHFIGTGLTCAQGQKVAPNMIITPLAAGQYALLGWQITNFLFDGTEIDISKQPTKYYFTIYPHKVTYIGKLLVSGGSYGAFFVLKNAKMDVPLIHRYLPYVAKSNVIVKYPLIRK